MPNLTMVIYTAFDGIESRVTWNSKEEYDLVKKFLVNKGVRVSGISVNNRRVEGNFVYVENEQQLEELSEYVRSLRAK